MKKSVKPRNPYRNYKRNIINHQPAGPWNLEPPKEGELEAAEERGKQATQQFLNKGFDKGDYGTD